MNAPPQLFDRKLHRRHRQRSRRLREPVTFLQDEVEERLCDRLTDIRRSFDRILIIGPSSDALVQQLHTRWSPELIVVQDDLPIEIRTVLPVQGDVEALPFGPDCFDAVISVMAGHWVNDLPGLFLQATMSLKPDGLLLAAFPGGETLRELRYVLTQAELTLRGGAAGRISPFVDVRDAGRLLQRAGLALPVADFERIDVSYRTMWALLADLRGMGETACFPSDRRQPLSRAVAALAAELYGSDFAIGDDRIAATFDIVFVTGWKPHPSQPSALRPGSALFDLADAAGATKRG